MPQFTFEVVTTFRKMVTVEGETEDEAKSDLCNSHSFDFLTDEFTTDIILELE